MKRAISNSDRALLPPALPPLDKSNLLALVLHHVLHRMCLRGLPCLFVVSCPILFVQSGNLWHQGVVRVGISQKRANGQQYFRNCQRRAPLILQNVKADATVVVNVGMIDFSVKFDFRWFEGIVCRKANVEEENTYTVGENRLGPMRVACQWKRSSPTGPALQLLGVV